MIHPSNKSPEFLNVAGFESELEASCFSFVKGDGGSHVGDNKVQSTGGHVQGEVQHALLPLSPVAEAGAYVDVKYKMVAVYKVLPDFPLCLR